MGHANQHSAGLGKGRGHLMNFYFSLCDKNLAQADYPLENSLSDACNCRFCNWIERFTCELSPNRYPGNLL